MTTYTIEIIDFQHRCEIWYTSKVGRQFEATLELRHRILMEKPVPSIAFKVAQNMWVNPDHCRVINEIKN